MVGGWDRIRGELLEMVIQGMLVSVGWLATKLMGKEQKITCEARKAAEQIA